MNNHSFILTAIFLIKSAVAAQVDDWCQGDSCMIFLLLYFAKEACHIIVLDVIQGLLYKVRTYIQIIETFIVILFSQIRNDENLFRFASYMIW